MQYKAGLHRRLFFAALEGHGVDIIFSFVVLGPSNATDSPLLHDMAVELLRGAHNPRDSKGLVFLN